MSALVKAAGLIITRRVADQQQYLLLKASYRPHHWTPPKGHVDPGEDDFKAALRETQEEAGFSAEDFVVKDDFKIELNYNANGKSKQVIYWLAVLNDANKMVTLSDEHTDFSWLSIEEACTRSGYSDMQEALRKAHEFINKA